MNLQKYNLVNMITGCKLTLFYNLNNAKINIAQDFQRKTTHLPEEEKING